jgi:hypothetical protein
MAVWQIQLLGGLRATRGTAVIAQFPSRPIAMLLAVVALQPQRRHSREELIELLWPGVELDVGRNRLRQVLATLRRLLEPPDVPPGSVLVADRQTVGLNAGAVSCDACEFEQLLRKGEVAQAAATSCRGSSTNGSKTSARAWARCTPGRWRAAMLRSGKRKREIPSSSPMPTAIMQPSAPAKRATFPPTSASSSIARQSSTRFSMRSRSIAW